MVLEHLISTGGLDKYVNPDELLDSAIDDQIEADDQAGELDSYMMQKWVVDTESDPVGTECDHPGDSVEVINAFNNDEMRLLNQRVYQKVDQKGCQQQYLI